jgi:hypothetical protein
MGLVAIPNFFFKNRLIQRSPYLSFGLAISHTLADEIVGLAG